jgi:hypothetical protein
MSVNNRIKILLFLISAIYSLLDEGNIYLPMVSNFTLEHSQNVVNNKNYYTIPLKIGTPEEEFNLQVDTSTSTTWVPSSKCTNCFQAKRLYEEEDSRTSSPTNSLIKLEDEDGNVEGYEISDNVKLGEYKLKQYSFIQVTKLADDFKDHYEGKLGLGFRSHLDNKEFNFLEKLKKNNLIFKKIFSLNAINDKRGMLLIGDLPGKQYKTYCNVTTDVKDVDDLYKESWICHLTHLGIFDQKKGISQKIKNYYELEKNTLVNFDSAYDFIGVPISEKENIEKFLKKADLKCTAAKKKFIDKNRKDQSLRNRIREEEMTITCKTNEKELKEKKLVLSFVLQGYVYSLPLNLLFEKGKKDGEMDMLIKYIDDDAAIWTFGYPFINQFLMIFNMEDNHVGIKKLKKTALPIVNLYQDWIMWKEYKGNEYPWIKIVGIGVAILVLIILIFFCYRCIRRKTAGNLVEG